MRSSILFPENFLSFSPTVHDICIRVNGLEALCDCLHEGEDAERFGGELIEGREEKVKKIIVSNYLPSAVQ